MTNDLGSVVTLLIAAQLMSYMFVYFVISRVLGHKTAAEEIGFSNREKEE